MKEVQDILIHSSASASSRNYFFLITELLKSPFINSAVIMEQNNIVLPQLPSSKPETNTQRVGSSFSNDQKASFLVGTIQLLYRTGHFIECIKHINRYTRISKFKSNYGDLGINYHYGLQLLRLYCYKNLNYEKELIKYGSAFIIALLSFEGLTDYRQLQYYLNETITLLTSREHLPSDLRDEIWDISLRTNSFFSNAGIIENNWNLKASFLGQIKGKDFTDGINVFYVDGRPFLKILFPWVDTRTQVIAKLNESLFINQIQSETIKDPEGPWKNIEYSIFNVNNHIVDAPFGTDNKTIALERILNVSLPQWKMAVFLKNDYEIINVGKRKIVILYILLSFSGCVLIIGAFTTIRGFVTENRVIKMKSNFLSAVTHELKTPLTSIRVLSELVESGRQSDTGKIKKYAGTIRSESTRLQTMIENVLNSVRLENEQLKIKMKKIDLSDLIRKISYIMDNAYKQKQVNLNLDINNEVYVKGERDALWSVVQNLLDNALKYSPAKTTVRIVLRSLGNKISLVISDEGHGIPQESIKHIFQQFYRAEDEMIRETRGTGLGLALVKQIIDQHSAKIKVESRVNLGTTFTILFPIVKN